MLKGGEEAREMAYWLKVFPILPKEQSSDPSTTSNSSSGGSDILFWLPHSDTMFHVLTTAGIKVCVHVCLPVHSALSSDHLKADVIPDVVLAPSVLFELTSARFRKSLLSLRQQRVQ